MYPMAQEGVPVTDIRAVEMEAGRFGRLVERPRARVFDAFSDKGNGYTVTLNARPELRPGDGDVCTCPAHGPACYHIAAARLRAGKVAAAATVPDGWKIEPEVVGEGVVRYALSGPEKGTAGTTYPKRNGDLSSARPVEAFVEADHDPDWGPGDVWLSPDALKARAALYLALAEDLDRRAAHGS